MEVMEMKGTRNILTEQEQELVSLLMQDCQSTGDIQAKLKQLFAGTIEKMLEAEMDEHLGYDKNSVLGNNSGNSRNGYNHKTIISDYGASEIAVPRDRNGEFEPKVLANRQTRTDEIEQKIMAMYAKGMSQRDIEDSVREIYGADIPQTMISKITDKILPDVNEWQNRPLEAIYPIIYFDGIVFKSRKDNQIINKCVYSVLGIDMDGKKDILGCWISENEGASFYAGICSDLKKRGVTDIFVACHDNLKGLGEAINAIFPKTKQQLCIVHQIRNSTKFVPYKDRKAVCADLKKIYGAVNLDDAEYAREEFRERWNGKYPSILRSWDDNWADLTTFFEYPQEIRHLIYTTNAVEAYHRQLRKFTKAKAILPIDDAIRATAFTFLRQ
jgi:putative transposase